VFHVPIWGSWSFVWGDKPTKAPRGDGLHICAVVSLRAHPVRGESHIQQHANREVATKDTRITQKWLFIAQYKADVTL